MCGPIRLVLLGNDKCPRDSALRGCHVCHFLQISLHLSADMADLQNVDYFSMFSAVFVASVVRGVLKIC